MVDVVMLRLMEYSLCMRSKVHSSMAMYSSSWYLCSPTYLRCIVHPSVTRESVMVVIKNVYKTNGLCMLRRNSC